MIGLIIAGCCVIAFFLVLLIILMTDKANNFTRHLIITGITFVTGVLLLIYGFGIGIREETQTKADIFVSESKNVSVSGIDYLIHEINPDDKSEIRKYADLEKFLDKKVLYYNADTKNVYKLEEGKIVPFSLENSAVYDGVAIK